MQEAKVTETTSLVLLLGVVFLSPVIIFLGEPQLRLNVSDLIYCFLIVKNATSTIQVTKQLKP